MGAPHAHNWGGRLAGFVYCLKCGVFILKNAVSKKACNAPCPGSD